MPAGNTARHGSGGNWSLPTASATALMVCSRTLYFRPSSARYAGSRPSSSSFPITSDQPAGTQLSQITPGVPVPCSSARS